MCKDEIKMNKTVMDHLFWKVAEVYKKAYPLNTYERDWPRGYIGHPYPSYMHQTPLHRLIQNVTIGKLGTIGKFKDQTNNIYLIQRSITAKTCPIIVQPRIRTYISHYTNSWFNYFMHECDHDWELESVHFALYE